MNEYKYDKNKVMMTVHCVGISAIQTRFILHNINRVGNKHNWYEASRI